MREEQQIVIKDQLFRDREAVLARLEQLMQERTFAVFRCYIEQQDREIKAIVTRVDREQQTIKLSHDEGFDIVELDDIISIEL